MAKKFKNFDWEEKTIDFDLKNHTHQAYLGDYDMCTRKSFLNLSHKLNFNTRSQNYG